MPQELQGFGFGLDIPVERSYPRTACPRQLDLDCDVTVARGAAVGLGSSGSNVLANKETDSACELLYGFVVSRRVGNGIPFPE